MTVVQILAAAGVVLSLVLGGVALRRRPRATVHWIFGAGMLALASEAVLLALSVEVGPQERMIFYQRLSLAALAVVPLPWLLFSSTFAREGDKAKATTRVAVSVGVSLVALVFAICFWNSLITERLGLNLIDEITFTLGPAGKALNVLFLFAAVGILMNLERTLHASVGTIRWRIKFMVLGVGTLFVVRIFTSSQFLLYSNSINLSLVTVNLVALPIACLLVARSLAREGGFNVTVYPSRTVLQNSVTVLAAGVYLLLVGVLAEVVTLVGGAAAFPVKAFLVLLALVGLTVLLVSDRVRDRTRILVSRHFRRPLHDYQKVWHAFTERTTSLTMEADLSRAVTRLVSESFQVLSVTLWRIDENSDQLVFAASTSLTDSSAQKLAEYGGSAAELRRVFATHAYPVDVEKSRQPWAEALKRCHPDQFIESGHRVCVPLVAGGQLLGLVTMGDRVSGVPLSVQDFDLLKCIGDQVAANLLNIQLSQRLLQAKEMEAFQTMSAFFVHDLKNTASTLSLMLRNLPAHFEDPAFRVDALRAVGTSVERINALINRLTLLRQVLELNLKQADLNEVVEAGLAGLQPAARARLLKDLKPLPAVSLDAEQMQKVLTNLVLNAWDAVGQKEDAGEVHVDTCRQNGWVVLSVADNGCGMTSEFMNRSLFRPFQTTKKKGIGIGMFHTKAIVEAHRGKIEVSSEVGRGTTFRVLLPCLEKHN